MVFATSPSKIDSGKRIRQLKVGGDVAEFSRCSKLDGDRPQASHARPDW